MTSYSSPLAPRLLLAALLSAVGVSPNPVVAQGPDVPWTAGVTFNGASGVTETTGDLMARARKEPPPGIEKETEPRKVRPDRRKLPQNPDSPPFAEWPPEPEGAKREAPAPFSPQTLGTTFLGATLSGVNPTGAFPPDSMGAVGPTQYVVAVNGRIVSFSKATGLADGVLNASTNTFFSSVRNGSGTSDPRIRFDRLSQRWFVVIINVSTPNRILLAVSDAASAGVLSASTVWTYFFLQIDTAPPAISSTCLMDYPTLGVDANALYIGGNNFCGSPSQTFHSTDGWVIRKSSVLGAGPIVATVFRALGTGSTAGLYTPQGVDNYDPAATEGYFVGVDTVSYGTLYLRRVASPGGTPSISGNVVTTVNATSAPLNAPHLGNTNGTNGQLDALDDRLFAAHLRGGRLFTAHNIGVDATGSAAGTATRTGSRWYELTGVAGAGTPTVVQSGTVFDPAASNPLYYWIPSIMVSGQGHAALGFSTAGTNARVNAATVGRLSGDPLGTTGTPLLYTSSSTAYNPPSDTGNLRGARRWGDYSYTSLDPSDDMTMWTVQEFCDATNSYGVQVVKLLAPPPATPSSAAPASVAPGATNVTVVVTGTSSSGSGFFDPAATCPTCPNRLAASVSGTGVTVNSVTYTDPTHVTLNVTVAAGAASGARNVTVTNPDGQAATGTGILTVSGSCPAITAAVTGGGTVCAGTPSAVTVTVSGGTPPYTVTLTNGGGTATGPSPLTFTPSPGTSTTFAVQSLVDSAACAGTGSGSATVTVVPAPVATAGGPQTICANGTTSGLGGNTPATGTGSWSIVSGGTGTFSPAATTPNATFTHTGGTGPIVLRWTVSNPPCAAATASVTVTVGGSPSATISGSTTLCAGKTATLSLTLTSGAPPWSAVVNGKSYAFSTATGSIQVSPAVTTVYTISSVTAVGCTSSGGGTGSATVTVNSAPAVTLSGTQTICAGRTANLTVTLTSGAAPFTVAVNGALHTFAASPGTIAVTPSTTTTYTVAAVTAGGCTNTSPGAAPAVVTVDPALCIDDATGDSRFRATVTWSTTQGGNDGAPHPGQPIATTSLGLTRGGLFWFFQKDNPEMLAKVLNGCGVNGRYWVFLSAGTNVGFTATVVDSATGASKSYTNADGTPALPVQDTDAFPCAPGLVASPGGDAGPGAAAALASATPLEAEPPAAALSEAACVPGATTLCIDDAGSDRRFRVTAFWSTVQGGGQSGPGNALSTASLGVKRGGLFWFFQADNPEMLAKVLNGCSVNGKYWVFTSAGTNVGLTTTVTDTATGASKTYTSPDLSPAAPVQDTSAFSCGP